MDKEIISPGIYRHFKGKDYEVITVAKHCDNEKEYVVYKALYGKYDDWIRPIDEFIGYKTVDGKKVKRFSRIE